MVMSRPVARPRTAVRVAMLLRRPRMSVGMFHDASVFMDRSQPLHRAAVVDAFGPSVHFLLFDTFYSPASAPRSRASTRPSPSPCRPFF